VSALRHSRRVWKCRVENDEEPLNLTGTQIKTTIIESAVCVPTTAPTRGQPVTSNHAPRTLAYLTCISATLASASVFAQTAPRTDFDLLCNGIGERLESHESYGSEWDSKKHKFVDSDRTSLDTTQIQATVQVEIHDGQGRVRLPKRLLPALASGGEDGWWPLRDLQIGPDRIQASYRLNGLNKPKLDIDRRTGHIRIQGVETFEGECSAVEPGAKRF